MTVSCLVFRNQNQNTKPVFLATGRHGVIFLVSLSARGLNRVLTAGPQM